MILPAHRHSPKVILESQADLRGEQMSSPICALLELKNQRPEDIGRQANNLRIGLVSGFAHSI